MPEPAVDPDGNVVMAWNIYSQYTYTGAPQQLVHSVPQIFNGVMMYRFGEDDVWTEEIPTATEPGVYTFQNYIKGNDGYMDIPMDDGPCGLSIPQCLLMTRRLRTVRIMFIFLTL